MNRIQTLKTAVFATLLTIGSFVATAKPANAVVLPPGWLSSVNTPGTSAAVDPTLNGKIVSSTKQLFRTIFNIQGKNVVWSGYVCSYAIRENSGKMTFMYRLISNPTNTSNAYGMLVFSSPQAAPYVAGNLDLDWRTDMGVATDVPTEKATNATSYVFFSWAGGLAPGKTSKYFYIRTNAIHYALNDNAQLMNTSTPVPILGPAP